MMRVVGVMGMVGIAGMAGVSSDRKDPYAGENKGLRGCGAGNQ